MIDFTVTDTKGYLANQGEIDTLILETLADGGKTSTELMAVLYEKGIARAAGNDHLSLAYSPLGAIFRSAVNSLRQRQLVHDSWDRVANGTYERPFRFFRNATVEAPA